MTETRDLWLIQSRTAVNPLYGQEMEIYPVTWLCPDRKAALPPEPFQPENIAISSEL
jgi:hypothetical protein